MNTYNTPKRFHHESEFIALLPGHNPGKWSKVLDEQYPFVVAGILHRDMQKHPGSLWTPIGLYKTEDEAHKAVEATHIIGNTWAAVGRFHTIITEVNENA